MAEHDFQVLPNAAAVMAPGCASAAAPVQQLQIEYPTASSSPEGEVGSGAGAAAQRSACCAEEPGSASYITGET